MILFSIFFFWFISLSTIPSKSTLHTHTHIYIHTHIDHIFFIHLSADGHLGYFHILSIVNDAAMNSGVHVLFFNRDIGGFFVCFSDIYSGVELLDHMVAIFLVFWGTFILFPVVSVANYIPINNGGGFPFLHILTKICYLHTSLCFIFFLFKSAFLRWLVMLSTFPCAAIEYFKTDQYINQI